MNEIDVFRIKRMMKQTVGKPCVLCSSPSDMGGVFVPNKEFAKKIGLPKGKLRIVVYPMCSKCSKKKDTPENVEHQLLADYNASTGNNQN